MKSFFDVMCLESNKSLSRQGSRHSPLERVAKAFSLSESVRAIPFSPQDFCNLCEFVYLIHNTQTLQARVCINKQH